MTTDLAIRCLCGAVQAVAHEVAPDRVNRVVCHCRYCQHYARILGRAERILDERGGTDVFQMSPRRLEFREGFEHIACMRLTPKGSLRWYAACCKTPIAHTLAAPGVPFMAINHVCIDWAAAGQPRDALIGPIRARVNHRIPKAQARQLSATPRALLRMLLHYSWLLIGWRLRGDHKRSPFFDPRTSAPRLPPHLHEGPVPQLAGDG